MKHLVEKIANKEYDSAKSIFENRMFDLVEKKLLEAKKATGAKMMEQSMGQVGPTVPEKRKTGVIEDTIDEKYGKGYVSPAKKIEDAMKKRGIDPNSSDKYRKEMERLNAQYEKLKAQDKKIDEQAAPALTPSGEADAYKLRDIIRSRMQSASGKGPSVGPSASSMSPKIPKTASTYKLPLATSEPSIPANAKQFSLPKAGKAPTAANVNVPKSSSNLDAVSNWAEKNITPKLTKAMPIIKKAAPYVTSIGKFMANPLVGAGMETMKSSPANANEPDYVKQNVEKQAAADKKSAEVTNNLAKKPYTSKSFDASKALGPSQSTNTQPMKQPDVRPTKAPEAMKQPDIRPTKAPEAMKMPDVRPTKAPDNTSSTKPPEPPKPAPKAAAPAKSEPANYDDLSFPVAYSRAREAAAKLSPEERGNYNFKWRGNSYQTNMKDKEAYIPQSQQKGTVGTDVGPSEYEKKLAKMSPEAAKADIKSQTPKKYQAEIQEDVELDEARIKIVKARVRGGKVQRRKKVSNVPGMTIRSGKLIRMSPAERRRRKMGQRRGKMKRRAKMNRILMKRSRSLRKRKSLGL